MVHFMSIYPLLLVDRLVRYFIYVKKIQIEFCVKRAPQEFGWTFQLIDEPWSAENLNLMNH